MNRSAFPLLRNASRLFPVFPCISQSLSTVHYTIEPILICPSSRPLLYLFLTPLTSYSRVLPIKQLMEIYWGAQWNSLSFHVMDNAFISHCLENMACINSMLWSHQWDSNLHPPALLLCYGKDKDLRTPHKAMEHLWVCMDPCTTFPYEMDPLNWITSM